MCGFCSLVIGTRPYEIDLNSVVGRNESAHKCWKTRTLPRSHSDNQSEGGSTAE